MKIRLTVKQLRGLIRTSLIENQKRNLSGIDAGVQDIVFDLQEAGYQTTWSCQGGPGHEQPWPLVEVRPSSFEDQKLLEKIAAESKLGHYRVTFVPHLKSSYVEFFPTTNVDELMALAAKKQIWHNRPQELKTFDGIHVGSVSKKERDYERGRDYTRGHGTRRLANWYKDSIRYMQQGDVIVEPEELATENHQAYDKLVAWLRVHKMSWNDIEVIFEDAPSTYIVYPIDSHHPFVGWKDTDWVSM